MELCDKKLPFLPTTKTEKSIEADEDEFELNDEYRENEHEVIEEDTKNNSGTFKVYSLADLSSEQIKIFVSKKGINNSKLFLDEIERNDAWAYTSRPQDLEEIVEFWNEHNKVGTHLELMEHSVCRRLLERDQDRADAEPISDKNANEGVRLLAAASTLLQDSTIRVPDGTNNTQGINTKSILVDWDDKECLTLLSRPIFDDAIYGTVRFHHRKVREYLTAKWFSDLLKTDTSRRKIEHLFFRKQYEKLVVTPILRPILSWLVLFDEKIRQKVMAINPEIILEGGDPAKLPTDTRREILKLVCEKIASNSINRSSTDTAAVQRFANIDIVDDIKVLIENYKNNSNVVSFLLRMIWQGRLKQLLPDVKPFALNNLSDDYTRIAAFRAVKEIGSDSDFNEILQTFLTQEEALDRKLLAELIDHLDVSEESVNWIFQSLDKVRDKDKYGYDELSYTVTNYVRRLDAELALKFIQSAKILVTQKPMIKEGYCDVSKKYGWLIGSCATAIENLAKLRNLNALNSDCLSILMMIPTIRHYQNIEYTRNDSDLSKLISEWNELNHQLFWQSVIKTRETFEEKSGERLTDYWRVSPFERLWSFGENDFELIKSDIDSRELLDDKLVAISLAFQIYIECGRPRKWREQLKKITQNKQELKEKLDSLLNPPPQSDSEKAMKRQQASWDRKQKKRKEKEQENLAKSKEWLNNNFEELRSSENIDNGIVTNAQYYLYSWSRDLAKESSHWSSPNWEDLIATFGIDVATAYRDGLLMFWRNYKPTLRSECGEETGTKNAVLIGLTGLEIESRENSIWPSNLDENNVELACRYAFSELNGFPDWFPKLYKVFPNIVSSFIVKEIAWELSTEDPNAKSDKNYILSDVSWVGQYLYDEIANDLFEILDNEPKNIHNLKNILRIIQSSNVISDEKIHDIASKKCAEIKSIDHLAYWYAAWIGVNPDEALPRFSETLSKINDEDVAKNLAMTVIVNLTGEKREGTRARDNFKTAGHLKQLYLIMHEYIRADEDIDRTKCGTYSPTLRDDAQDARNRIYSILKEIPGKEAYFALLELSGNHPDESFRSWILKNSIERAETDADLSPWTSEKFIDFNNTYESTPSNHHELFDFTVLRLLDLKDELENGDTSIADILVDVTEETKIRNFIGNWFRENASERYKIPQEEELADSTKPDLRIHGVNFDAPIPIELKLAEKWTGPVLFDRLENQPCKNYLRDNRSNRGIYLLFYLGGRTSWQIPPDNNNVNFDQLIIALNEYWESLSSKYSNIDQIEIIGIDLTKRGNAN